MKTENGYKDHADMIDKFEEVKKNTQQAITVSLYVALGISQKVFQQTQKIIMDKHDLFVQYNENNKKACEEGNPIEPKEMTKDQTLDCVLLQEQIKTRQHKKVIELVNKKGKKLAIFKALGTTKPLMDDFVFNQFGFECRDIENGIQQHNLLEDAEFMAIKEDASKERMADFESVDLKLRDKLLRYIKKCAKLFGISLDYRHSLPQNTLSAIEQIKEAAKEKE